MFPGSIMMGAMARLLPPSIPSRFFATAVLYHLTAWVVLAFADPAAMAGFAGGQGPALAALHLITLGVLAMTGMGAAVQLLPVATRRPLGPEWAIKVLHAVYAPGVAALTLGFGVQSTWMQHLGTALVVGGLGLFAWLVAGTMRKVTDLPGIVRHTWTALGALAGLAILGVLLVIDFTAGMLPDRAGVATAHAVLAGYGFMGMLALGFSTVLIPMFVLGSAIPDSHGKRSAALSSVALALAAGGALTGFGWLTALGGLAGLGVAALHFQVMRATLKGRMRKRLEPFFRMVWVAWALLPVSLLVGIAAALGAPVGPLWAFLLVFGWLLTFVTGILQRIMPFLASMHSAGTSAKPALLSHLTPDLPIKVHFACHLAALAFGALAMVSGWEWSMRLCAAAGLGGAIAFAAYAVGVLRRYHAHLAAFPAPTDTKPANKGMSRC